MVREKLLEKIFSVKNDKDRKAQSCKYAWCKDKI